MAAFSTIALTSAAVLGTGYSVYAGERGNDLQKMAQRRQRSAQDEALRIQMIERQRSVQAEMRNTRPTPTAIDPIGEALSSDRTGGIDDRLRLGRATKLGGGI